MTWLNKYVQVEPLDELVLSHPKEYIVDRGGHIFFAIDNNDVAGTFAFIKSNEWEYELSKMAVKDAFQEKGIGNAMLTFPLQKAKEPEAKKVILFSNTKLGPAIHLYYKYGFKEVPIQDSYYNRSNIKMEIEIV